MTEHRHRPSDMDCISPDCVLVAAFENDHRQPDALMAAVRRADPVLGRIPGALSAEREPVMMNKFFDAVFSAASIAMCAMVVLYIAVLAPGTPEGD